MMYASQFAGASLGQFRCALNPHEHWRFISQHFLARRSWARLLALRRRRCTFSPHKRTRNIFSSMTQFGRAGHES